MKALLRYDVFGEPIGKEGNCYYFISSLRKVFKSGCLEPWEYQRSIDQDRVAEMAFHFKNEFAKTGNIKLRGSIILCWKNNILSLDGGMSDKYFIIDGQHRIYSLNKLLIETELKDINVRFDILIVKDDNEIRQEFVNINKSVPVPFHYLTPSNIVDLCCNLISIKCKKAFKDGKCRRPIIDINVFKDTLLKNDIIEKYSITNGEDLFNIIMKVNDFYKDTGSEGMQKILGRNNKNERQTVKNCFDKCMTGEYLFFGCFKDTNWIIDMDRCKTFFLEK